MKTSTYHITHFGSFAPNIADGDGYVTYHCSERYQRATDAQLAMWAESRYTAVRNAALTEQCERRLAAWRRRDEVGR
jgi:hypothetical protein